MSYFGKSVNMRMTHQNLYLSSAWVYTQLADCGRPALSPLTPYLALRTYPHTPPTDRPPYATLHRYHGLWCVDLLLLRRDPRRAHHGQPRRHCHPRPVRRRRRLQGQPQGVCSNLPRSLSVSTSAAVWRCTALVLFAITAFAHYHYVITPNTLVRVLSAPIPVHECPDNTMCPGRRSYRSPGSTSRERQRDGPFCFCAVLSLYLQPRMVTMMVYVCMPQLVIGTAIYGCGICCHGQWGGDREDV